MKQQLIALILEQIKILQAQLNEMLAQQKENNNLVRGLQESVATATAPKAKEKDNQAPVVDFGKWKNKIESSFKEHDWCKNEGYICGEIGLSVDIQDPAPSSGIDRIEYYIQGVLIGTSYDNNSQKVALQTSKMANGEYTIIAKVYDKDGNVGEGSVSIETKN